MIDFVGTPSFLRIALQVAIATMHFQMPKQVYFGEQYFWHSGDPREQLSIHEKLPWGCKVGQIRCRGIFYDMWWWVGYLDPNYIIVHRIG